MTLNTLFVVVTLFFRSEYLNTFLATAVGGKKNFIEVKECSHRVLSIIIDFIYGTKIPDDLSLDHLKSLLGMADLYLMEDLKEAISSSIGKKLTTKNLLEMFQLGETFTAQKLKELCAEFLISNKDRVDVASKVLGANMEETFKKRRDFQSSEEYHAYMVTTVKPNMIVQNLPRNAIGRVVRVGAVVVVKWQSGSSLDMEPTQLEILTPPINLKMKIFSD